MINKFPALAFLDGAGQCLETKLADEDHVSAVLDTGAAPNMMDLRYAIDHGLQNLEKDQNTVTDYSLRTEFVKKQQVRLILDVLY